MKLTRVIPARRHTIDIAAFKVIPYTYNQWVEANINIKKKIPKTCWWCGKSFKDQDQVTIAVTKGSGSSKWFCSSCTELIRD